MKMPSLISLRNFHKIVNQKNMATEITYINQKSRLLITLSKIRINYNLKVNSKA